MKKQALLYFGIFFSLLLVGLIFIQAYWIRDAYKLHEAQFDHRVGTILNDVSKELSTNEIYCYDPSILQKKSDSSEYAVTIEVGDSDKLDSLLHAHMKVQCIYLDFDYTLTEKTSRGVNKGEDPVIKEYACCFNNPNNRVSYELKLHFKGKTKFILSQMAFMLSASVLLILLLMGFTTWALLTIWKQKKLSEMTTDFINNMTHELKTPIATIGLASSMLQKEKIIETPDKIKRYADIIREENRKLQQHVEHVLRMAQLDKGELKLELQILSIHHLLEEVVRSFELQLQDKNGYCDTSFQAKRDTVLADSMHMRNVFSNLIDNSLKYNENPPIVKITSQDTPQGLLLSFSDNGIGMSKEKQKHVFEKFYRVPTGNVHTVKGFGLGLAYVKKMIDAHKGQIHLQSDVGKGSTFEILLPYAAE